MSATNAFRTDLQRRMDTRHLSQLQVAESAHCSRTYVCRVLSGARTPSPDMIDRLGVAVGMTDLEVFHWIVKIAVPERLHPLVRGERVITISDLMTKLEQVGIGGRAA